MNAYNGGVRRFDLGLDNLSARSLAVIVSIAITLAAGAIALAISTLRGHDGDVDGHAVGHSDVRVVVGVCKEEKTGINPRVLDLRCSFDDRFGMATKIELTENYVPVVRTACRWSYSAVD